MRAIGPILRAGRSASSTSRRLAGPVRLARRAGTGARRASGPPTCCARPSSSRDAPARGPGARHGPRCLRALPERHSRRRPRTHPGVHRVPIAPRGADLRRRTAVCAGTNTIEAVLSDGWYRGRSGSPVSTTATAPGRPPPAAGGRPRGRHRARHRHGRGVGGRPERHRRRPHRGSAGGPQPGPDGRRAGCDGAVGRRPGGRPRPRSALTPSPAPPTRRIEELDPVAITDLAGPHVVDFGQNINGWVRLQDLGPEGTRCA